MFLDENNEPVKFFDAVVGGNSVGIPGTPALMKSAHRRWGKIDWEKRLQSGMRDIKETP